MPPYPRWRYFPTSSPPAPWVSAVVEVFAQKRLQIDSAVDYPEGMKSDAVLAHVATGLVDLGFDVETGKRAQRRLPRPVFFGDKGTARRTYEIDAFNALQGVALEVEAGRATKGNNIYRDLIQDR